jgi:hypothetical protein
VEVRAAQPGAKLEKIVGCLKEVGASALSIEEIKKSSLAKAGSADGENNSGYKCSGARSSHGRSRTERNRG